MKLKKGDLVQVVYDDMPTSFAASMRRYLQLGMVWDGCVQRDGEERYRVIFPDGLEELYWSEEIKHA